MGMSGGWIIDLDIRKYFDSIKWTYLCDILKLRVRDGVLIRLIKKWMNAGIMEDSRDGSTSKTSDKVWIGTAPGEDEVS